MKGKLILPPDYLKRINGPLIFLAGPILGSHRWQDKAIEIIHAHAPELYIACPRRNVNIEKDFTHEMYEEQVDWETYHLRKAGKKGVILFWLAKESKHRCDRSYAQTTRFELGEWKARHEIYSSNLVVGIEEGFTGSKYIKKKLSQECPDVPVCSTLEETCEKAIELALSKKSNFIKVLKRFINF